MSTNKKYTCGSMQPSGCVLYTGELPTFLPSDFPCDPNIDELLEAHGTTIESILSSSDLKNLTPGCLSFTPATITIKQLHQIEINKICDHEVRLIAVEDELDNLDIGSKLISIDMGCLTSDLSPCQVAPNQYSLLSILLAMKDAICALNVAVFNS